MFTERTSVGLDVHARSVVAAAIDGVTGELILSRLTPSHEHIRSWLGDLPGPVAVAYEAGPTGVRTGPGPGRGRDQVRGRRAVEALAAPRQRLLRRPGMYVAGKTMRDRWELASPAARARGDAGNRRLNARWNTFRERRKRHVVANVAIARELAGWCWSLAVLEE